MLYREIEDIHVTNGIYEYDVLIKLINPCEEIKIKDDNNTGQEKLDIINNQIKRCDIIFKH